MTLLNAVVGPNIQDEPIAGYVLKSRLGSGGYGEVWEAEAPGGLRKAVKFVYGALDEVRAQRELKSLDRIKEVRHPFLLSIERIEMVGGRLIIVTELAQGCVKTRFEECRQEGLVGIPREELLGYLRDAAEALDFLHEQHSLQHLDVKPENLLIVGNHVKVADFGLIKDLREAGSILGGLTPLYCPPEVLDGRPSRYSDQYALAIVYQEMLTGEFPFLGRTAAQLAAQHLHSPPKLLALPAPDRPLIARALLKNPEQRFASCCELIDGLSGAPVGRSKFGGRRTPGASAPGTEMRRDEFARTQLSAAGMGGEVRDSVSAETRGIDANPVLRDLPPLELSAEPFSGRPALLIGLGGTGGWVLSHLRRRMHARFGDADAVPAWPMLLIDSDVRDLSAATFHRAEGSLPARSTLAIPLRPAKDYRGEATRLRSWISRRWLYNVPRSLQTEAFRPLGRLAFVDHAQSIFDRLRAGIEAATRAESIQQTRQATGLEFAAGPPTVYVIASVAGGTGSGGVLDLVYAVREILNDLEMPESRICTILIHSTRKLSSERDLAIGNTLACLAELAHFGDPERGYPGDASLRLSGCSAEESPLADTYFVHLGNDLSSPEFDEATGRVADYLCQNLLPPAAQFFDRAHSGESLPAGTPHNGLQLRTFGLALVEEVLDDPSKSVGRTTQTFPESAAVSPPERHTPHSNTPESDEKSEPFSEASVAGHDLARSSDPSSGSESADRTAAAPSALVANKPAAVGETDANIDQTQQVGPRPKTLADSLRTAVPGLIGCGGARRTLVLLPAHANRADVAAAIGEVPSESLTFAEHARPETVVCQEMQEVPLARIRSFLIGNQPEYIELASRLHTRVDVEWSSTE